MGTAQEIVKSHQEGIELGWDLAHGGVLIIPILLLLGFLSGLKARVSSRLKGNSEDHLALKGKASQDHQDRD